MKVLSLIFGLPRIPVGVSLSLAVLLVAAAASASWMTPRLVEVTDAANLEATVPRAFGDWKELPSPFVQVSLATGTEPDMDQPYDQTVMRTYVNSDGQHVMLALAWGRRQRQEVKIHRPDLCYVAQGYDVKSLAPVRFDAIAAPGGDSVLGNHMFARTPRYGEAVSYWIRIGTLFSEDAVDTRLHILKEGLRGRVPDGILVRASMRGTSEEQLDAAWPLLDSFLADLVKAVPKSARQMLVTCSCFNRLGSNAISFPRRGPNRCACEMRLRPAGQLSCHKTAMKFTLPSESFNIDLMDSTSVSVSPDWRA